MVVTEIRKAGPRLRISGLDGHNSSLRAGNDVLIFFFIETYLEFIKFGKAHVSALKP
jgi:hypothetical protein